MTKKSFDQEQNKPIDYFREAQVAKTTDKPSAEHLVTSLRSDLLPASQELPASENIFQRINLKITGGLLIFLVILGLVWFSTIGPGRPILEQNLFALVHKIPTQTQQFALITTKSATSTPLLTNTPQPSSTLPPTSTPTKIITATATLKPATATPTPSSVCRDALSITLADIGKSLCVQGVVIQTITNPNSFMVIFSDATGAFYWVAYDLVWSKAELNTCYQINGTISQIANSPVLVFGYHNLPKVCP